MLTEIRRLHQEGNEIETVLQTKSHKENAKHRQEMEILESKVKFALVKKDEVIENLQDELETKLI
jgi:hypothetical protein